jgi:hypothetical protein
MALVPGASSYSTCRAKIPISADQVQPAFRIAAMKNFHRFHAVARVSIFGIDGFQFNFGNGLPGKNEIPHLSDQSVNPALPL